jgi:hypothetical protein
VQRTLKRRNVRVSSLFGLLEHAAGCVGVITIVVVVALPVKHNHHQRSTKAIASMVVLEVVRTHSNGRAHCRPRGCAIAVHKRNRR